MKKVAIMNLKQENYENLIDNLSSFLMHKLKTLDLEYAEKNREKKNDAPLLLAIYESGSFLINNKNEDRENFILINGILADVLEGTYQNLLSEKNARQSGNLDEIKMLIPILMASYRKLFNFLNSSLSDIKSGKNFTKQYVNDNRTELILIAIKKTVEETQLIEQEYKYSLPFVYAGYAILFLFLISALAIVTCSVVDVITDFFATFASITNNFENFTATTLTKTNYYSVFKALFFIFAVFVIVYLITLRLYLKFLKKKADEGNVSARFVSAQFYVTPILGHSIKMDLQKYVYEIFDCAQSGYPKAIYEVGKIYEFGFGKIITPNIQLAKQYYSKASKYVKEARVRYNILSKKI